MRKAKPVRRDEVVRVKNKTNLSGLRTIIVSIRKLKKPNRPAQTKAIMA